MVAKNVSEEFENLCNRKQRKCGKIIIARIVAISVIVFLVLMVSIIYHGIVLERMDKLRQIMMLNAEHQEVLKNPTDTEYKLKTSVKFDANDLAAMEADFQANDNLEDSLQVKHEKVKFFHHRLPRDLANLIDPLELTRNELDFRGLYAKVRNKRTQIALRRLEKEYVRCKKESPLNGNDCMVAFVKMYQLAKEITEKMEKMKEIFKDSEKLLQQKSESGSYETVEKKGDGAVKSDGKVLVEKEKNPKKNSSLVTVATEATTKKLITSTIATTKTTTTQATTTASTTPETTTTLKILRPIKIKPMKFSWIIDGNDDEEEFHLFSIEDLETTTTTTTTTTSTTKTTPTTTTVTTTTTTPSTTATTPTTERPTTTTSTTEPSTTTTATTKASTTTTSAPAATVTTTTLLLANTTIDPLTDRNMENLTISATTTTQTPLELGSSTSSSTESIPNMKELVTTENPLEEVSASHENMTIIATTTTTNVEVLPMSSTTMATTQDSLNDFEQPITVIQIDDNDDATQRKLKYDWIIDGDDDELTAEILDDSQNTSTTVGYQLTTASSTLATTIVIPQKPKLIKYSWIIDSGVISAEQQSSATTKAPVLEKNRSAETQDEDLSFEAIDEKSTKVTIFKSTSLPASITTTSPVTSAINNTDSLLRLASTHPLDNPSSMENMLESSEHHEGKHLKPIKYSSYTAMHNKTVEVVVSTTGSPIDPYNSKEWEKTFQKASGVGLRPQEELIDSFGESDAKSITKFGPKLNPTNTQGLGGTEKQFKTLCERISHNLSNKGGGSSNLAPIPEADSENFTKSPSVQFTSRGPGGFPVTGETMKASAQFMFNPNFGMPTIPICFFVTPASFRMMNQAPMWTPSYMGMTGNYGGSSGALMGGGGPGGIFFVPQNFGTTGNMFGHSTGTASGSQGNIPNIFSKNATPQKQQKQIFCTYMQNQQQKNYNNAGQQGSSAGGGSAPSNTVNGFSNANFKLRHQSSPTDIIYASYAGLPEQLARSERSQCILPGETACYGGHECINTDSWCDGRVDCSDGSDEAACTCRNRLAEERLCDGYPDCPMGEDEIGCFGCAEFMYSCYNSVDEYERHNRSAISMCYSTTEKCDGFENCLNGRDEAECNIIVNDVTDHMSHSVSASEGVLYHNYRGEWFPVCNNAEKWASEACEGEYGSTSGVPNVTYQSLTLHGPFIEPSHIGGAHFPQSCQKRRSHDELTDHVSYVKCAPAKCGITELEMKKSQQRYRSKRYAKLRAERKKHETKQEEIVRIVGGSQSKPLQWPFIVAIYRNGNFHCGGSIYTERWIISAAHCVINHQKYYYEVRAGLLRRTSYAASTQIQPVSHIVVHQAYERRTMRNDLSLLRLAEPLKINRWVKPICLPDKGRTTKHNDWVWGPEENTICFAVGWGAVREKGPGSDHLREVSLPIRKRCKEKEDQEAEDICAGDIDGGRDACQGDSGGPLFCRSVSNAEEWYLAGVVSHGTGCARAGEFGVYTRVALYLDWIEMAVRPEFLPLKQPLHLCPGFICIWGGQRCISQRRRCDRVVDCLGGEDEVGCIYNFIPDVASVQNNTTESDYYPENIVTTPLSVEENLVGVAAKGRTAIDITESSTSKRPNITTETLDAIAKELTTGRSTANLGSDKTELIDQSTSTPQATFRTSLISESSTSTESPSTVELQPSSESTTELTSTWTSPQTMDSSLLTIKFTSPFTTEPPFSSDQTSQTDEISSPTTPEFTSPFTTEPPFGSDQTSQVDEISSPTTIEFTSPFTTEPPFSTDQTSQIDEISSATKPFSSHTEDIQKLIDKIIASITEGIGRLDDLPGTKATKPYQWDTAKRTEETTTESYDKSTTLFEVTTESSTLDYKLATLSPGSGYTKPQSQAPQKFICKKIPQIIDSKHRCDRIVDCEDATDEDDCNCRDYLKGTLSTLICDGKTDCEDLTDEEDCGNCSDEEFLCPLSKTCLPSVKRCDNVIDCKFKEDEKDCFALTNGNDIVLDLNKQPVLSHVGVFSRNTRGVWRIVCSHETGFHQHSSKTAIEVCALLGFKGYKFFNTTTFYGIDDVIPIDPDIPKKSRLSTHFSAIAGDNDDFSSVESKFLPQRKRLTQLQTERIEETQEECFGLYLECNAKSNKEEPLKTLSAGSEITPPSLDSHKLQPIMMANGRPNVFVKPHVPTVVISKKEELLDKLDEVMESKKNQTVLKHDKLHEALEELHWPWLVDIYANGRLWCIGALVDKHWVMVHESCLFGIRLQNDYVVALFGGGKTQNNLHKSPNEAVRRIDCYEVVMGSDVLIFHLEETVHFSHHVLPISLPTNPEDTHESSHECMAIVHDDETGRVKTVAIAEHEDSETCVEYPGLSCYQLIEQQPPYDLMNKSQVSQEDLYSISAEIVLKEDSQEYSSNNSSWLSPFTTCKHFGHKKSRSDAQIDPIDQALLVCRAKTGGWYPQALFSYNNSDCSSFRKPFGIRTLQNVYETIEDQIDKSKCSFSYAAAPCSTWRCPLGSCLEVEQICDDRNDCHDGSDEDPSMCLERNKACKPSEMKCRSSNKCIPKTKFCDHVTDCDDLTDEPTVCSCFTYLQATDPGKICDGIRNCWDKSDESPVLCNCTESLFACGRNSNECIPQDFVCDKVSDCPNGEDEKYCYGIEHPIESEQKKDNWKIDVTRLPFYGQVIEQSYGIWHTKCFPRSSPPDVAEIRQICGKLGYSPYRQPSYRLIDDTDNKVVDTNIRPDPRSRSFSNDTVAGRYRYATKAKIVNKFSPLHLNEELTLFLKPSRPIAELVRWNATDSSNCYRLEIKCA